mgnify:CR=1 FL=1
MQPFNVNVLTPLWEKRNVWVSTHIPLNSSILDIGCGNKSILKYVNCTDYLGLDKTEYADINTDLNNETVKIPKVYDIGLILGVLEYVDDPIEVISKYKNNANTWIILTKSCKKKEQHNWKHSFNVSFLEYICYKNFTNVTIITSYNGYLLGICNNEI